MKVTELEGIDLERWVARAMGIKADKIPGSNNGALVVLDESAVYGFREFRPSSDWSIVGKLLTSARISVFHHDGEWEATIGAGCDGRISCNASSAITAILRCYVMARFGDFVPSDAAAPEPGRQERTGALGPRPGLQ